MGRTHPLTDAGARLRTAVGTLLAAVVLLAGGLWIGVGRRHCRSKTAAVANQRH